MDSPVKAITAAAVCELREMTDEPLMVCKKALMDAGGDMEVAKELIRTRRHGWNILEDRAPIRQQPPPNALTPSVPDGLLSEKQLAQIMEVIGPRLKLTGTSHYNNHVNVALWFDGNFVCDVDINIKTSENY